MCYTFVVLSIVGKNPLLLTAFMDTGSLIERGGQILAKIGTDEAGAAGY